MANDAPAARAAVAAGPKPMIPISTFPNCTACRATMAVVRTTIPAAAVRKIRGMTTPAVRPVRMLAHNRAKKFGRIPMTWPRVVKAGVRFSTAACVAEMVAFCPSMNPSPKPADATRWVISSLVRMASSVTAIFAIPPSLRANSRSIAPHTSAEEAPLAWSASSFCAVPAEIIPIHSSRIEAR